MLGLLPDRIEKSSLQSCQAECGGVPAGRYTRNSNISSNFIDNVVTEEEHFEGDGDPKMYCSEDKDDEASGLCFSLAKRVKGYLIKRGEPNEYERTEARIGYTFAPRNHPERPKAIPTSAQRTIGTGITHSTCCGI